MNLIPTIGLIGLWISAAPVFQQDLDGFTGKRLSATTFESTVVKGRWPSISPQDLDLNRELNASEKAMLRLDLKRVPQNLVDAIDFADLALANDLRRELIVRELGWSPKSFDSVNLEVTFIGRDPNGTCLFDVGVCFRKGRSHWKSSSKESWVYHEKKFKLLNFSKSWNRAM